MPVFISYSHADKDFVDVLGAHLVKANASVWIDRWELNVGDSIIGKVQDAIEESDALLVVLSEASVQSEWCKKELTSGLLRELEEKRVVVLPLLLQDCSIPLFLRDKMYADFRSDFGSGLHDVLNAIAKVTNANQGRIYEDDDNSFTDWAMDWGFADDLFFLRFPIVTVTESLPVTILTEIIVTCNDKATRRYTQYKDAGLERFGRAFIAEALFDYGEHQDFRILLEDTFPQTFNGGIEDEKNGLCFALNVSCRKLGEDNGKDQLVNISDYLKSIREYVKHVTRPATREEAAILHRIIASPMK